MTANNNWPSKPGVPLNPEKDGWHWLDSFNREKTIVFWHGENQGNEGHWEGYPLWIAQDWVYLGPVLLPDEAAKREDVKWHEGYAVGVLDVRRGTAFGEPDPHYAALQARVAKLEGALKEAATSIGEWGAYASQYLQDKWDLSGEVARYIAIAEEKNDAALGGKDELLGN